jgi:hypothetical protein
LYVFQLDVAAFGDSLAPSVGGNALQHFLALIPRAGGPNGGNSLRPTEILHDESSQRLALNIFCDYDQRLASLRNLL